MLSLKSLLERLPSKFRRTGLRHMQRQRKHKHEPTQHKYSRPYRDRAIVEVFLGTGVRREELMNLNLDQIVAGTYFQDDKTPRELVTPDVLRKARRVQLVNVYGKNRTLRNLYVPLDARNALADYLETERGEDAASFADPHALFLRASSIRFLRKPQDEHDYVEPEGDANGRLTVRSINKLVHKIGELHDAEQTEPKRKLGPLHPHIFRHTFGFRLAKTTNADKFELQRRLGHQSEAYIKVYTDPPAEIAAGYVEEF